MRWDLKRFCTHCPFANTDTRITFACRNGFVCHEHGESDDDYEEGGIVFRDDGSSQHCWGAIAMYLKNGSGSGNVPWEYAIEEDEDLEQRWWDRADMEALKQVFDSEEAFIEANDGETA